MFNRLTDDERILKQGGMGRGEVLLRRRFAPDELERLDAGAPVEDISYQRALDGLPPAYDLDAFPGRLERLTTALGLSGSVGTLVQGTEHTDGTRSYQIMSASSSRGDSFFSRIYDKKQQPDRKFVKGEPSKMFGGHYVLEGGYEVDAFGDGKFNRHNLDLPMVFRYQDELINTFYYDIYLEWYKATRYVVHGQNLPQLKPKRQEELVQSYRWEAYGEFERGALPIGDERCLQLLANVAARSVLELNPELPASETIQGTKTGRG